MYRKEVIDRLKKYFDVRELVCPHTFKRFGEGSWEFIDTKLLEVLLWLRESLDKPIVINTYHSGGTFTQRGLRCNRCELVKNKTNIYLSEHCFGMAIDFHVPNCDAEEVRQWIDKNKQYLPHPIRLERDVNWVHLGVRNYTNKKIQYFNG